MTREAETAVLGVLDEILTELKAMHIVLHGIFAQSGSGASSVEISTSTRGHDIRTKAYADSPITEAGQAAMDEYLRLQAAMEERLMNGFKTGAQLRQEKGV